MLETVELIAEKTTNKNKMTKTTYRSIIRRFLSDMDTCLRSLAKE